MLTSAILTAGKARVLATGWYQGSYYDERYGFISMDRSPVCVLGALNVALKRQPDDDGDKDDACHQLFARVVTGTPNVQSVPDWNDAKHRTLQDVLDAFDAAIAIAEAQEAAVPVLVPR